MAISTLSPVTIGDWPMYQHDAANSGYSEAPFPNSLNQIWFKSFEDDFNISMISMFASPIASNGKIFIPGDDNDNNSVICALNQYDGSLIWKKEIPINANAIAGLHGFRSPAVYDGKVFTVIGCFIVQNNGPPESLLDWEVDSTPGWGEWTIDPNEGYDLKGWEPVSVNVEIKTPDEKGEFTGELKIVNSENPDDYEIIDIYLENPRSKTTQNTFLQILFEHFPNAFPILRQLLGYYM